MESRHSHSPEGAGREDRSVSSPIRTKERPRCAACDNPAPRHAKFCQSCPKKLSGETSTESVDIMAWIKDAVAQGIKEATGPSTSKQVRKRGAEREVFTREESPVEESSTGELSDDEQEEILEQFSGFDFALVEPLVKAVRQELKLPETQESQPSTSNPFKILKKDRATFPLHEAIKEIITSEWDKMDARFSVQSKIQRLYPFSTDQEKVWEKPPRVDAAVARLSKRTVLPVDDVSSFSNPMDRKMEAILKKSYLATAASCRPAIALTSVSRAMQSWLHGVERAIKHGVDREDIIKSLADLKLATDFVADASIDLVKTSSRALALSVAARRALWLRSWNADKASKTNLCNMPFEGDMLFGAKLEDLIKRVTGGKSVFLPQERRQNFPSSGQSVDRQRQSFRDRPNFREQRAYRPGREYSQAQNWRRESNLASRTSRGRGSSSRGSKKYF
uniref:Lamina-associated polypeptide 2 alpha C-terminal domain-containing protein n=1 Tax=Xenopus tropicalis TaxID=8364 RepID=A0A803JGY9_XENTR